MMSQYDDKNKQVKAYHKQWLIWAMALVGGNALAADYEVNVGSIPSYRLSASQKFHRLILHTRSSPGTTSRITQIPSRVI